MPIVKIWGMTDTEIWVQALSGKVAREVKVLIAEVLGLEVDNVTVIFPATSASVGQVIVEIGKLFPHPDITDDLKRRLAETVGCYLKDKLVKEGNEKDQSRLIEVFVGIFDPARGFWSSE